MKNPDEIFDLIRSSEMNAWVGGADPEAVGNACMAILQKYLVLDGGTRTLDFGCGVGRVLLSLLKHHHDPGAITGMDIMPQVIRFCRQHIASAYPKASFELLQGNNNHYDGYINSADPLHAITPPEASQLYANFFTSAYAFSVFTHVEAEDFRKLLKFFAGVVQPGGDVLLTCFLLNPQSRSAIGRKNCVFPFENNHYENDGLVFVGNAADRLGFIGFDLSLIQQWVFEAGLHIKHIEFGAWSGLISGSLQDIIVCQKPQPERG